MLWTDTAKAAEAVIRHALPKICLIRPKHTGGEPTALIAACRDAGIPCVILLARGEWSTQGWWLGAGATDVIELERIPAVLQLIGEYTGLAFAKEQRAGFETVVEVCIDGHNMVLETTDISASGAGLRGLPEAEMGTLVRLSFAMSSQPMIVWGRVVRAWNRDGERYAGVRFIGMSAEHAAELRAFVEAQNARLPQPKLDFETLFDDLVLDDEVPAALRSEDLVETLGGATESDLMDPDFVVLRRYARTEDLSARDALDLPNWLLDLYERLTDLERSALEGQAELDELLVTRVSLARWRANNPKGPLPSYLAERAYELFNRLGAKAEDSDHTVARLGSIRASILRELLSGASDRVKRPSEQPRAVNA